MRQAVRLSTNANSVGAYQLSRHVPTHVSIGVAVIYVNGGGPWFGFLRKRPTCTDTYIVAIRATQHSETWTSPIRTVSG